MDAKFERRFKSFCNSLDALAEARQRDLSDSFVLSGTSAKFSITFDLSWKVMKDILVQYYSITGFVTGSPREVLRESFKAKLISDDAWMDMLKVRNELAHDYDCEVVRTHCNTIVEKYITGGQHVEAGQALYRIDTRSYASALAAAQASAAQASATYENAKKDLARYEQLVSSGAISKQAYDGQKSSTEAYRAVYEAAQAQVQIASDNLGDTIVTAPFSGTLSMDDVNIGTFATAGTTGLVTLSSSDPLYVQFDMSESEYLQLTRQKNITETLGSELKLRLSDGSIYSETGKIVQVSPGLNGGQLTMKASFANPNNLLIPGMYATIVSDAELAQGSILVPTKALIQLLNKDMLDVVVDGKVQQKAVKVGATYGLYTIIESGIDVTDEVIVEGQNKVQIGQAVEAVETTREEMEESATKAAADQHGLAK